MDIAIEKVRPADTAVRRTTTAERYFPTFGFYPILHGMERQGHLRSQQTLKAGRTGRVYRATAAGRKALVAARLRVQELFGEMFVEVLSDLRSGDEVAAPGTDEIRSGADVRPSKRSPLRRNRAASRRRQESLPELRRRHANARR